MHRKEINERSPLRVLESSIHGGLGAGKLGVVVARHGVGKTAFLVGVALDDLMRGRKVLHKPELFTLQNNFSFFDSQYLSPKNALLKRYPLTLQRFRIHSVLQSLAQGIGQSQASRIGSARSELFTSEPPEFDQMT